MKLTDKKTEQYISFSKEKILIKTNIFGKKITTKDPILVNWIKKWIEPDHIIELAEEETDSKNSVSENKESGIVVMKHFNNGKDYKISFTFKHVIIQ